MKKNITVCEGCSSRCNKARFSCYKPVSPEETKDDGVVAEALKNPFTGSGLQCIHCGSKQLSILVRSLLWLGEGLTRKESGRFLKCESCRRTTYKWDVSEWVKWSGK
ncbi:MAG: hypothetical protein WCJ59_02840 [bacterium]